MIDEVDILMAKLHVSMLSFTKYFFYEKMKKKFVVNSHHELICNALDRVIRGDVTKLMINLPPRYSKTEIVVKNFIAKGLALNPQSKFIHLSYSDDLACDNSEEVRELVKSEAYQQLYPHVQIKQGSDSKKKWYTTEGGGVYATAAGGQVTGFGAGAVDDEELEKEIDGIKKEKKFAGAIIIDDPIKPDDANSEAAREKVNTKFETTIRNRVNSRNTPIIIIMQRLHEHDLCGYLQEIEGGKWEVLSLPAILYEDGEPKALWPFKHTLEELNTIKNANSQVFETQYMQNPTPLEGLMYGSFKTYDTLPITKTKIRKNYTDTADTGADFLCSINYVETEIGNFITDVLYTDKPMEYTEPMVAAMLHKDGVNVSNIESNNGGRGFARQVEAQTRLLGNNKTKIEWFHQSANKQSRIFSRSNEVTNLTYFPSDWERRWPSFARHIKGFRKDGKDMHDDAEDCLTGTIEMRGKHDNEMKYYNGEQQGKRVAFVMPDNNGKFIVLNAVVNEYINIDEVVYQPGFDEEEMKRHLVHADDIVFECDKAFFAIARELRETYDVRILHKNTNPMLRISANKSFVVDKVRFRDDYDEHPQYTAFMDAVMDEANCFEAMDAVSALSVYIQKKCFS